MTHNNKTLWQVIKGYFNAMPDKENEEETIRQINSGVPFHGANLWVLVFAILIASLGLNVNSTAVIIGAMLISPLMGPIIGMGLAIGITDLDLLKRSITSYLVATTISVATATTYFLITPLNEAQSELLARTSPTLYDVLIALCGGAAGILAISTKGKGNVIPGVAIATALMPPLCTAGYGLAVGNLSYFLGAFYLFFINTVFIILATYVGVRMLKFEHKQFVNPARMKKVNQYIIGVVILTMIPSAYMTIRIITRSMLNNSSSKFVKAELDYQGTRIISEERDDNAKTLNIVAVGKIIPDNELNRAQGLMSKYGLGEYKLNVIQGSQTDSLLLLNKELASATTSTIANQQKLIEQSAQIQKLESELNAYTRYADLGKDVRREAKAMFPIVRSIAIAKATEAHADTTKTRNYVLAVVDCEGKITPENHRRLSTWLKERVKADSLRLIVSQ